MDETIITVRGRFESHHPAEHATVRIAVAFEGSPRESILQRTTHLHAELTRTIEPLHDPEHGPVTWWASDRPQVWSDRPWNADGRQLPLVHHSAIDVRVTFSDFVRLGEWLAELSIREGITVSGIDWTLTDESRKTLEADARGHAVEDARITASDYAAALGLASLRPLAVADPGMLGDGAPIGARDSMEFVRMAAPAGAADPVLFRPEDITVRSEVDARFAAS
ncbi:SIMPL domain-containing protein [Planctomonas sp. JC2975]|uniref:SIMPL domain-containing protein n=1 Tax=Planctomonas sp. JC2975 TaxID=2729626 RepID=UPI0014749EDD|nr:SIMPL domain-containing protein [Planctomonas sp. JC2975]NNC11107.1 SIMPL domain-containing protein [Planctomonas sp. JC2975]